MSKRKMNQEHVIPILSGALAILMAVSYWMPYGKYVYSKKAYHMSAMSYFTGKRIAGGSATIEPQKIFVLGIVAILLFAAAAVLYKCRQKKTAGIMTMIGGAVAAAMPIVFMYNFNTLMSSVKKTSVLYGAYLTLALGILALILGFYILYLCKTVNLLDIMIIPGLAYLIINNYIPMSGIVIAFKELNYSQGCSAVRGVALRILNFYSRPRISGILSETPLAITWYLSF